MNTRKTLFLVVLVAIGAGLVVWDHFRGTSTADREAKSKHIVDLNTKQVSRVELVRSNQTVILEKSGDHWDIKKPLAVRAEFSAVSSMLDELEFAERSRTLTEKDLQGASLTDFGLEPPRAMIKLQTKSGMVTLRIGNETPMKNALYVQVDGRRQVCVASKSLYDRATESLATLRSHTVIEFTPSSVTRLEIKGSRVIELTRSMVASNTESRWAISQPMAARADQNKVSELLNELSGMRVQDFISDDSKDLHAYRLDEPERIVTIYTGEAGQTLLIGSAPTNDPGKVYAKLKSADAIYTIAAESAKKFAVLINDLRDPRVLVFEPSNVQGVEIVRGADRIALKHEAKGWQVTEPVPVAAEESAVNHFFADLTGLRAKRLVADVTTEPEQYGLAKPAATVTLTGAGTNVVAQLLVGSVSPSNDVRFVQRADEPFIYGVETNALDSIPAHYRVLRSRLVFDLQPEQITKLVAGDVTLAREKGQWKLVAPAAGVLDVDAVNTLVTTLAKLSADSFGRSKTDADAGLGHVIQATVGDATHWLAIAPDGHAAASSVELTFKLPPAVVGTLTQKLLTALPAPAVMNAAPSAPMPAGPARDGRE